MRFALAATIAGVALAMASAGLGAEKPHPGPRDPRIRTVFYDPDDVVQLMGDLGYQMAIEFGDGERIENVAIGNSLGWQVTPNKKATVLFLKPLSGKAATNMTVFTDRRRYVFQLAARDGAPTRDMAYVVRFLYPPEPPPPAPPPPPPPPGPPVMKNRAYSYTGSRASLPALVFDDGNFTYFKWPENTSTPALFLVAPDGSESLANYGVRDGYQIVEQLAPRFVLRNGKEVTYVINDGWREPGAGPYAPRPHDRKTEKEAVRSGALEPVGDGASPK
jgi:type IV secretion system protein VirB9